MKPLQLTYPRYFIKPHYHVLVSNRECKRKPTKPDSVIKSLVLFVYWYRQVLLNIDELRIEVLKNGSRDGRD